MTDFAGYDEWKAREPEPSCDYCDKCTLECTRVSGECDCCDACIGGPSCDWCGAALPEVDATYPPRYCDRECWLSAGGQL